MTSQAQQDAQYTQYMYNTLSINPAYTGSRDLLSITGLYRTQWVGLEGAPKTATLSAHSPISDKMGLGLNIVTDDIFLTRETYVDAAWSYFIQTSEIGRLSFGLKVGGHFLDINTARLITGAQDGTDPNTQIDVNRFSPQLGLGLYYYTDEFYIGLSAPNVLKTNHFEPSQTINAVSVAREKISYYLMAGYVFDINKDWEFKPAGLFKAVEGAPLQLDLSTNFRYKEKFTLGAAYRWSAAFSLMGGFQLNDQIMIGVGYDRETTELAGFNNGSYEIMLRYDLLTRRSNLISPRFF